MDTDKQLNTAYSLQLQEATNLSQVFFKRYNQAINLNCHGLSPIWSSWSAQTIAYALSYGIEEYQNYELFIIQSIINNYHYHTNTQRNVLLL